MSSQFVALAEIAIKEIVDKSLIPVKNDDGSIALDYEEFPRPAPPSRLSPSSNRSSA